MWQLKSCDKTGKVTYFLIKSLLAQNEIKLGDVHIV
jgi:hypothetical protein